MYNRESAKNSPFAAACFVDHVAPTIGIEAANAINVALVFQDANSQTVPSKAGIFAWLTDDANGQVLTAVVPTVAIGTNGLLMPSIANKSFDLVCNNNGLCDITITKGGGPNVYYLQLLMPDGHIQTV